MRRERGEGTGGRQEDNKHQFGTLIQGVTRPAVAASCSQVLWMSDFIWPPYLLGICVVQDTVVLQLTKELHSQQSVQGHEEQEEQRDVVDLLTRTPNKQKHAISNTGPAVSDGKSHYVSCYFCFKQNE
jgi:hypothetical protein